ncbi:MAG: methylmalonyl-CoA mutase family protein, partial [Anaerolineae bacterium]
QALDTLRQTAKNGQNTMPAFMNAVKTYATLGEMTAVLKEVYGTFQEPVRL